MINTGKKMGKPNCCKNCIVVVPFCFSFLLKRGDKMINFFNSKRNRTIAGAIVIVLVASMVVTTILSVL